MHVQETAKLLQGMVLCKATNSPTVFMFQKFDIVAHPVSTSTVPITCFALYSASIPQLVAITHNALQPLPQSATKDWQQF